MINHLGYPSARRNLKDCDKANDYKVAGIGEWAIPVIPVVGKRMNKQFC